MITKIFDISGNIEVFFKEFGIPEQDLNLTQREFLEEFLLEQEWQLTYLKDQWCGCIATHYTVNEEVNNKITKYTQLGLDIPSNIGSLWQIDYKYTGEGESSTECILAVYVLIKHLLSDEDINYIRQQFETGDKNVKS